MGSSGQVVWRSATGEGNTQPSRLADSSWLLVGCYPSARWSSNHPDVIVLWKSCLLTCFPLSISDWLLFFKLLVSRVIYTYEPFCSQNRTLIVLLCASFKRENSYVTFGSPRKVNTLFADCTRVILNTSSDEKEVIASSLWPNCISPTDEAGPSLQRGAVAALCKWYKQRWVYLVTGAPGDSVVKNPPAVQETCVRTLGREDPCRRRWHYTPVFLPGESRGQRSLVGYSP